MQDCRNEKARRPAQAVYARLAGLVLWTVLLFLVRLCALPARPWRRAWDRRARSRLFCLWARGALRLMGIHVTVEGLPPQPPFLQVSNHVTFADVFVLASLQGCVFVSMAEVRSWPVVGWMARTLDIIFVQRERRRDTSAVNRQIREALAASEGVHLFPEGGVADAKNVGPFKSALLQPAVDLERPVHYAALCYRTVSPAPPASEAMTWGDGVSFLEHFLTLLRLPGIECTVVFGDRPMSAADRKELAQMLHEEVRAYVHTAAD